MNDPKTRGVVDMQLALQWTQVTKTATFSAPSIDMGAGYAPGGGTGQTFQVFIPVASVKLSVGDETYTFSVEHSDDNATWKACSAPAVVDASCVAGGLMFYCGVQKRYVRLTLTIAGTAPTITYGGGVALRPVG